MSVPRGIPPHTNRYDYNATCFTESLAIAGTMVPPDQVREVFGPGFERQFLVVEVGFYSKNHAAFDVRPSDFALRAHPSRSAVKPADSASLIPVAMAKSLPEVSTASVVAGYLFFPRTPEIAGSARFDLDYTGYGTWLSLPLDSVRHHH